MSHRSSHSLLPLVVLALASFSVAQPPENGGRCGQECCFRFAEPEVPQVVYPEAQPNSIGDHQLNVNNRLVLSDGGPISGCNGDDTEFFDETLGEEGEWTRIWTGSDNVTYDYINIFYSTADTAFNVRTIQTWMDPNLRDTLANRLIRTNIRCNNGAWPSGESWISGCVQFTLAGGSFSCDFQKPPQSLGCVPPDGVIFSND